MTGSTTRYYLDTNVLVDVRQYLECSAMGLSEATLLRTLRGGKAIADSLDDARSHSQLFDIRTSYLAQFEIHSIYRKWLAVDILIDAKLPVHSLKGDGNLLQHITAHPTLKSLYEDKLEKSLDWFREWSFRDVVTIDALEKAVFDIVSPMQGISPSIQFIDALHLASAIAMGADYLVTSDKQFKKVSKTILDKFNLDEILPNGQPFAPTLSVINPDEFKNRVVHTIKVKHGARS